MKNLKTFTRMVGFMTLGVVSKGRRQSYNENVYYERRKNISEKLNIVYFHLIKILYTCDRNAHCCCMLLR